MIVYKSDGSQNITPSSRPILQETPIPLKPLRGLGDCCALKWQGSQLARLLNLGLPLRFSQAYIKDRPSEIGVCKLSGNTGWFAVKLGDALREILLIHSINSSLPSQLKVASGLYGCRDLGLQGVSARGGAGATSTRARALNCTSPLLLALHPSLDLCGFRVL